MMLKGYLFDSIPIKPKCTIKYNLSFLVLWNIPYIIDFHNVYFVVFVSNLVLKHFLLLINMSAHFVI